MKKLTQTTPKTTATKTKQLETKDAPGNNPLYAGN